MKKNWILLIFAGVLLFIFILGTSYACYEYFDKEMDSTAKLEIKMHDWGQGVIITDAIPVDDIEGKKTEPYRFEIKNNGKVDGHYKLIIEEAPFNKIKDGCTTATLLNRNQLRYQLVMNGKEIAVGELKDVKNNIIDFKTISSKENNQYQLRVWLKESAFNTEWENKHYHYSINIVPVLVEEDA